MTNYEMVELLRQKANVSYEEAKAALEAANWDLLDAIVLLEREGKVPENDARFSTKAESGEKERNAEKQKKRDGAFATGHAAARAPSAAFSAVCSTTATATSSLPRATARK